MLNCVLNLTEIQQSYDSYNDLMSLWAVEEWENCLHSDRFSNSTRSFPPRLLRTIRKSLSLDATSISLYFLVHHIMHFGYGSSFDQILPIRGPDAYMRSSLLTKVRSVSHRPTPILFSTHCHYYNLPELPSFHGLSKICSRNMPKLESSRRTARLAEPLSQKTIRDRQTSVNNQNRKQNQVGGSQSCFLSRPFALNWFQIPRRSERLRRLRERVKYTRSESGDKLQKQRRPKATKKCLRKHVAQSETAAQMRSGTLFCEHQYNLRSHTRSANRHGAERIADEVLAPPRHARKRAPVRSQRAMPTKPAPNRQHDNEHVDMVQMFAEEIRQRSSQRLQRGETRQYEVNSKSLMELLGN